MCVYSRRKFQVSSKILTSFRQRKWRKGDNINLPPSSNLQPKKETPKKPTQIRVKVYIYNFEELFISSFEFSKKGVQI